MRVYIGHPKSIDYLTLYKAIRSDEELKSYEIILPHEYDANGANSREFYQTLDIFIAEVSEKATGLGIELGWAYDDGVDIYALCNKSAKVSNSVRVLTDNIYLYEDIDEMIAIVKSIIKKQKAKVRKKEM